jgi:hypothetical protein
MKSRDASCTPLTLAIVYGNDEGKSCQKAAEDESQPFVGMVVLSTLLFLQFGVAISMSPVEATTGLQLSMVKKMVFWVFLLTLLYCLKRLSCVLYFAC